MLPSSAPQFARRLAPHPRAAGPHLTGWNCRLASTIRASSFRATRGVEHGLPACAVSRLPACRFRLLPVSYPSLTRLLPVELPGGQIPPFRAQRSPFRVPRSTAPCRLFHYFRNSPLCPPRSTLAAPRSAFHRPVPLVSYFRNSVPAPQPPETLPFLSEISEIPRFRLLLPFAISSSVRKLPPKLCNIPGKSSSKPAISSHLSENSHSSHSSHSCQPLR